MDWSEWLAAAASVFLTSVFVWKWLKKSEPAETAVQAGRCTYDAISYLHNSKRNYFENIASLGNRFRVKKKVCWLGEVIMKESGLVKAKELAPPKMWEIKVFNFPFLISVTCRWLIKYRVFCVRSRFKLTDAMV